MRKTLSPAMEASREPGWGEPGSGPNGAFMPVCPETGRRLRVIVNDGRGWGTPQDPPTAAELAAMNPAGRAYLEKVFANGSVAYPPPVWAHLSVSSEYGCPVWAEMVWLKDQFWEEEETVIQFHPPKSSYVNVHSNCLHMWSLESPIAWAAFDGEGNRLSSAIDGFPMPPQACV